MAPGPSLRSCATMSRGTSQAGSIVTSGASFASAANANGPPVDIPDDRPQGLQGAAFRGQEHERAPFVARIGVYAGSHNELTVEQVKQLAPNVVAALVFTKLQHKNGVHDGRMSMIMHEGVKGLEIAWFHNTFVTTPKHHQGEQGGATGTPSYQRTDP